MFEDFLKFVGYVFMAIVMIVVTIIAAPKMWEQATSDKATHPHSGATPDCPTWDISLEEGMEKAELVRQLRK